jgi:predicted dehydrogenase
MNKIINVGIIGYGMSSEIFHSPFINTMDEFKLSAIVTTNEIGINKIKTKYPSTKIYSTVDKILSDKTIQLIIITTPNKSHFEITKKSLLSNKNVIVEKPFTLTVDKANELIKLAHNENRMLTVYHNRRFDSDFLTIKKIISNKTLGILKSYESHFDRFRPIALTNRWREKNELGAGTLYDLGSHLIDQALDLFGMPDKIFADIIIERENAEIEDCFSLTLYYSNFRVYLKSSTLVAGKNLRFQLT